MSVISCPTDCSGLPNVYFNLCAPELHYGEITKVYFTTATGDDFVNWTSLAEWTGRLADSGGTGDSIRTLILMGDMPAAESTEIPLSADRTARGFKRFTLNLKIDETNETNRDMIRTFDCDAKYKIWYETADGYLYGGNTGVSGTFYFDEIIPVGREELQTFTGTFKWKAKTLPERILSPLA